MNHKSAISSRHSFICLFFLSSALSTSTAFAKPAPQPPAIESHSHIIQTSRQFLDANIDASAYSRVEIKMGHLDPRLRLTKCEVPLTTSLAAGSRFAGKTTVHIRCSGAAPWTAFLSSHIRLYANVIKTAQPLTRGHILQKSDLIEGEENLGQLKYGFFTETQNLLGKQLTRRLPQNKIIKANYIKSPTLIKRGELVSIIAENSGYSVKMTGTAMMNGARGERIRVKNLSSKRIIEGIVKASGVVSIN
ncbi:Flagellar basal-body P-ring formation protein FlgA [hydrothermal vent metagenome]|uniref:Flagellar basal-body P-ring formation protein FlgA n=1 Tax=hydrothermal vent metagenome TaxID=652676 RepID=A0A3B0X894_9ZZZZ